ncbi:hypothetical protein [Gemmobacter sp. 24YEA27]|uniref:hypothetical protein n=1 Tax=Gemmobacter sp. 24YEA27 TaxID=3040672 RepID=UPI0024B36B11|nr:hypothetical protein [Gemmobacter sp. 24YEA27]
MRICFSCAGFGPLVVAGPASTGFDGLTQKQRVLSHSDDSGVALIADPESSLRIGSDLGQPLGRCRYAKRQQDLDHLKLKLGRGSQKAHPRLLNAPQLNAEVTDVIIVQPDKALLVLRHCIARLLVERHGYHDRHASAMPGLPLSATISTAHSREGQGQAKFTRTMPI